jgi:hypothetical protein
MQAHSLFEFVDGVGRKMLSTTRADWDCQRVEKKEMLAVLRFDDVNQLIHLRSQASRRT